MAKHTILYISENILQATRHETMADKVGAELTTEESKACEFIPTVMSDGETVYTYQSGRTFECKSLADTLKDIKDKGIHVDAVLLHDSSVPEDSWLVKRLHQSWTQSNDRIKQLRNPDYKYTENALGIQIEHSEEDEPVKSEQVQDALAGLERLDEKFKAEEIADHQKRKHAAESFLLDDVHDKGIAIIRALREDSYFKDVPIVVGFAHEKKEEQFRQAGATDVATTESFGDSNGCKKLAHLLSPKNMQNQEMKHTQQVSRRKDTPSNEPDRF